MFCDEAKRCLVALALRCSYDYSGYGVSSGRASEKNMYADIEAAWLALRSRYSVDPDNIVLYGQSIGTVPTVHLATRYQVAAVVLHSPLMSGMRVAFPRARRTCCLDVFNRFVVLCELLNLYTTAPLWCHLASAIL